MENKEEIVETIENAENAELENKVSKKRNHNEVVEEDAENSGKNRKHKHKNENENIGNGNVNEEVKNNFVEENDREIYVEDESEKDEVDPGVDTERLNSFLRRKIGKTEDEGKKLKKLNKSGEYVAKTGTTYKPTEGNLKKNSFFKDGGYKKSNKTFRDNVVNKKNYKSSNN